MWSEQVRRCIFSSYSLRHSMPQDGVDTRSLLGSKCQCVVNRGSSFLQLISLSQQLQLTGHSDTSPVPAHCKHYLCPCALAQASAAAHCWARTLGYSCLWSHLLQLFFIFFYIPLSHPSCCALTTAPEKRGPALIFLPRMCRVMLLPRKTPPARGAWALSQKAKDKIRL